MNFFTKRTFSILGTCLWALATAHASTEEKPDRPASARMRRTTHFDEAKALWAVWSTQFKGSSLTVADIPEDEEDDDSEDSASTLGQTPKQQVMNAIEAHWASLVTQQLYVQCRAPIMPEDLDTEQEREEALEEFQQQMETYEQSIQEKATRQAQEAIGGLLYVTIQAKGHARRRSSVGSFESDFSEISLSGNPVRRSSTMSGDGPDSLDDFKALKKGFFDLAESVDALAKTRKTEPKV